ncbi:hypothetical protein TH61_17055 [Rufibacter sp. DG15C]|uniref:hypothetical protein n=1 Tax=Rufibacter sp. DG15C TaxID=1379909 RepID=UPI00078E908B|nr:hypothetical protein [Rufibacter sp. DG15C]AMM52550.1 hypothetical protein TH61_17055 [Rufibacter sp. DG15C]
MRLICLLVLCCLFLGCQSKDVQEVPVTSVIGDSLLLDSTVDSVATEKQDGTLTAVGPPKDVKQQLPSELEVVLDQTHGMWQLPLVQDQSLSRFTQDQQGPYFLQTDLDKDQRVDYAVQITDGKTATVLALMRPKQEGQAWQEKVLASKPMLTVADTLYSPFTLSLPQESRDSTRVTKGLSGILLQEGKQTSLFYRQNRKWHQKTLPAGIK